ncbi:MAG: molybdopterin oxidoreductase family protein [Alphaproteobacteria bacterium]|nr:molybdopterin oxidoreductase family protein [Alphaproteobacteria bacterium]
MRDEAGKGGDEQAKPGAERWGSSACPHDCPSTCALEVELLDARTIGRVRGAADNNYTAGVICAKVARYAERVHHPDRLLHPMKRVGPKGAPNGLADFARISWDEALDAIATRFLAIERAHGPQAIWPYFYAGTMGLVNRDGINRLRHAKRYSGWKESICVSLVRGGWKAGTGRFAGSDPREMADSKLIVMWGGNPVSTQVNVMTHVQRARKKGGKLVVVDPYRSPTAQVADLHLAVRPGTDGALACALMHCWLRDGHADRDFLAQLTDFGPDVEAHLQARSPAWAATITGLTVAEIEHFATLYATTRPAFLRVGYGFSRQRNGSAQVHAVSCLPAVLGAWKEKGGGAFFGNGDIYHWDKTLIEGLDVQDPSVRLLDQSRIGPILTGDRDALKGGPPVMGMLVQSTNPAVVAPESLRVRQGLLRDDLFLAVHEQFFTHTCRYADIILPATMFLEHDDLYQAGGHQHIQIGRKLIEPPGECRPNHDVVCAVAKRVGAEHRGFAMTAWEMIDTTLRVSGWPGADEVAEKRWLDVQPGFREAHFLDGFGWPDRRFRFKPDWAGIGPDHARMPRMPDHLAVIEEADAEHPFRMVAAPARNYLNTTFTETPTSKAKEGRPTALVHPADLKALGLTPGDPVRVGNRRGAVTVHAKAAEGQQRGVVVVESIWPNDAFPEGIGINALTSADPGYPNGGAVFHDTAVWLKPVEAPAAARASARVPEPAK